MVVLHRYDDQDKQEWNQFIKNSKNALFMFDRDYMDYHKDRFFDHSLMFYYKNGLIAVLPACEGKDMLVSHGGLTYGGFICGMKMKQHVMNECFDELMKYGRKCEWSTIIYKPIPHIFHNQASEEDKYSLYSHGAKLVSVDASTALYLQNPLKMSKGRKAQIVRARREGVEIRILEELDEYNRFIDLENEVLIKRHNTMAVHSGAELKMLHDSFPANIQLYGALLDDGLIAGAVLFVYDQVVHVQYMASNDEARRIGALDLVIATIIDRYKEEKKWLDFGISTEHDRIYLNEGLIAQKEDFGGRTLVYEKWQLDL